MLRIRLRRVGKKKKPSYRIVVADSKAPRDGAYVDWIGNYDPMADPPAISLKKDRAIQWLSQGAQPSDAVRRILDRDGILVRAPKFRSHSDASETQDGTTAPTVTITRAPAPAAAEVTAEETVAEESVEEVTGEEETGEAPEETPGDGPEDETGDEARPE